MTGTELDLGERSMGPFFSLWNEASVAETTELPVAARVLQRQTLHVYHCLFVLLFKGLSLCIDKSYRFLYQRFLKRCNCS